LLHLDRNPSGHDELHLGQQNKTDENKDFKAIKKDPTNTRAPMNRKPNISSAAAIEPETKGMPNPNRRFFLAVQVIELTIPSLRFLKSRRRIDLYKS
jgi:hypothetical protein